MKRKAPAFACLALAGSLASLSLATGLPAAVGLPPVTPSKPPAVPTSVTVSTPAATVTAPVPDVAEPESAPTTPDAVAPLPVTTTAVDVPAVEVPVLDTAVGGVAAGTPPPAEPANGPAQRRSATPAGGTSFAAAGAPSNVAFGAARPAGGAPDSRTTAAEASADDTHASRSVGVRGLRADSPTVRGERFVRLRFVLDRAGRVVFVVFGPAPSCAVAGRFAVLAHRGANSIRFDGRLGSRRLEPGLYEIAPRLHGRALGNGRSALAVRVGSRGVRPLAHLPELSCGPRSGGSLATLHAPPFGRVEGAQLIRPKAAGERAPPPAQVVVRPPAAPAGVGLSDVAASGWPSLALIASLMWALLLLGVASVDWGYTAGRFKAVRVLDAHRLEIGLLGATFLAVAAVLFLIARLY